MKVALLLLLPTLAAAQSPDSLIQQLEAIHAATIKSPLPISERAMNIYLSNKLGYYLSDPNDLTLYKNSVLLDAATGQVAVNHSLYQPKGLDQRTKTFTSIGVKTNVRDVRYTRFGFLAKQTWITKEHIRYADPAEKTTMDALTTGILQTLTKEIRTRAADFKTTDSTVRQQFNTDLRDEYYYTFALRQSEMLARRLDYSLITLDWTSLSCYIPLITENTRVAPAPASAFTTRHGYPLQLELSHTRLWESVPAGRFYLTITAGLLLNNSRDGYQLDTTASKEYYLGDYSNFLTSTVTARFAWFPPTSHVGFSLHAEQSFGPYHALNGYLGVPIVLIDKKAEPACNFEFEVRFFDLANTLPPGRGPGKTAIGLTVGIPFSKIAF
ncbi:MAG: hypothetical protein JST42_14165 [Bacteroidetes bacterium]|nr:hypothetical protein [Bacteroidota bacterium]